MPRKERNKIVTTTTKPSENQDQNKDKDRIIQDRFIHDTVTVRTARSGKYPPMIISLPRKITDAMKLKKGESLTIWTEGRSIHLHRFEDTPFFMKFFEEMNATSKK